MARFPANLKFNRDARQRLLKGINVCADAVSATLGPQGRNVAINRSDGPPLVIHDGVTVAKRVDLFDEFEDMGASLLKQAAIRTNDTAGDGTTLATVLARALVIKGIENIEAGANPMTLRREIEKASKTLLKHLKDLAKDIQNHEETEQIATISSADPELGKMIAEALKKVGDEGVLTVEEGQTNETFIDYTEGMEIDRGYLSPYFVTDQKRVEAVVENAKVLVTDIKMNREYEIVPFMQRFIKSGNRNLVIIGETLENALATLVVNKLKGTINVVAIQPPAFGGRQTDELEDIAILTGGTAILKDSGRKIEDVEIEELGSVSKAIADRDKTILIGGGGTQEAVRARVDELSQQIKMPNSEYDADVKRQRQAKLTGKVAVINVGGHSPMEVEERKERVIDAVNATEAAIDEGVVAGGELALLWLSQQDFWGDTLGANVLKDAIKQPFNKLMENAGYDSAEIWGKVTPLKYPYGIDVIDGKKKNLIKSGIIDPHKVVRSALENAVSVATLTFTTDVLISEPYGEHETTKG